MRELLPKFIIEDSRLILGKVFFHKDLSTWPEKVKGGGWFYYNPETTSFLLYGSSEEFGRASKQDIVNAINNGWCDEKYYECAFEDYGFLYSEKDTLYHAINNTIILKQP